MVLLNAAAGFVVSGLSPDLASALPFAAEQIDSGSAYRKLEALRAWTNE
jgi:anthranilate phosphoribosyltransferase